MSDKHSSKTIICLLGPTASGKTPLAVNIVQHFPCEIISVDSAMIYRDMDIGTAKPSSDILHVAPHHLINIRDPAESYSAGEFVQDAMQKIEKIIAAKKIPLLVGGTMMYFHVLSQGLARLPRADSRLRQELQMRGEKEGWQSLHEELAKIDPTAASRIHPQDSQRISRALEVFRLTGKAISSLQMEGSSPLGDYAVHSLALAPTARSHLHARIEKRFQLMLESGLVDEVRRLYERGDLSLDLPSIRSVGYRQVWEYFLGEHSFDEMREKAIASTRQLAKRQLTWLRSWPNLSWFDSEASDLFEQIKKIVGNLMD